MSINKYFILFFCLLLGHNAFAQVTNKDVVAKIKTEEISELIKITSTVTNNTDLIKSLRYVAYVFKENPQSKNVSRNEQSGRFVLQGSEQKTLCTTNINSKIKDKVTAVLLIYDSDDKLVAKDRFVVINNDEEKVKRTVLKAPPREDYYAGFRGIITEDTKTKPGRDFYVEFSSAYRLKQINGIEIVKIVERFSFGRNTIMEVIVGDKVVHRFFVKPTRDFIEQQSKIAIINVSRYFVILEKNKNYIKQY
ncbi:CsgE family curli-type amyloid fiber assembly protein [Winogradskyella jejuensis]|uniref:Curli production assembly/transport component CsgE n=1 Tax=Winogradskyella jejuensis TaxID=1089305 RepID=A0A1M5S2F2_9FLAO|nr:CsgE family curli-type amyloid fiber assembly protein [Winogradskyella jejuensis]SHH32611.1 Curli assembly protein CsgE [Winogradskyella jejuensis]